MPLVNRSSLESGPRRVRVRTTLDGKTQIIFINNKDQKRSEKAACFSCYYARQKKKWHNKIVSLLGNDFIKIK